MDITKILLSIIVAIMIVTTTNATTMCVTDDNTSIILDPNIKGTSSSDNSARKTWTVTFDYGTVSGIATCNSTSGTFATAYPEYNYFDNNHTAVTGGECWCKMTNPVRSAWVYNRDYTSGGTCSSQCSTSCGDFVRSNLTLRRGIINAAGM